MGKCLETNNLPIPNHDKLWNSIRLITSKEIELVIKCLPIKKIPGCTGKFYKTFKALTKFLLKLFQKSEDDEIFPNTF